MGLESEKAVDRLESGCMLQSSSNLLAEYLDGMQKFVSAAKEPEPDSLQFVRLDGIDGDPGSDGDDKNDPKPEETKPTADAPAAQAEPSAAEVLQAKHDLAYVTPESAPKVMAYLNSHPAVLRQIVNSSFSDLDKTGSDGRNALTDWLRTRTPENAKGSVWNMKPAELKEALSKATYHVDAIDGKTGKINLSFTGVPDGKLGIVPSLTEIKPGEKVYLTNSPNHTTQWYPEVKRSTEGLASAEANRMILFAGSEMGKDGRPLPDGKRTGNIVFATAFPDTKQGLSTPPSTLLTDKMTQVLKENGMDIKDIKPDANGVLRLEVKVSTREVNGKNQQIIESINGKTLTTPLVLSDHVTFAKAALPDTVKANEKNSPFSKHLKSELESYMDLRREVWDHGREDLLVDGRNPNLEAVKTVRSFVENYMAKSDFKGTEEDYRRLEQELRKENGNQKNAYEARSEYKMVADKIKDIADATKQATDFVKERTAGNTVDTVKLKEELRQKAKEAKSPDKKNAFNYAANNLEQMVPAEKLTAPPAKPAGGAMEPTPIDKIGVAPELRNKALVEKFTQLMGSTVDELQKRGPEGAGLRLSEAVREFLYQNGASNKALSETRFEFEFSSAVKEPAIKYVREVEGKPQEELSFKDGKFTNNSGETVPADTVKSIVVLPEDLLKGDGAELSEHVYKACMQQTGKPDFSQQDKAGLDAWIKPIIKDHVKVPEGQTKVATGAEGLGLDTAHPAASAERPILTAVTDRGIKISSPEGEREVPYAEFYRQSIADLKSQLEKVAPSDTKTKAELEQKIAKLEELNAQLTHVDPQKRTEAMNTTKAIFEKASRSTELDKLSKQHGGGHRGRWIALSQLAKLLLIP